MGEATTKKRYRSKISAKIVLFFFIIALLPLTIVGFILVSVARGQLLQATVTKQQLLITDITRRVDDRVARMTEPVAFAARLYTTEPAQADQALTSLLKENPDMQKVELVTVDGKKRTAQLSDSSVKLSTTKLANSDTTLDFLETKPKLLATTRDDSNNDPHVVIGLPILKDGEQPAADTPPSKNMVLGGIIATFAVDDAWKSILPDKASTNSTAYVVDETGKLIYHADKNFLSTNNDIKDIDAVRDFLGGESKTHQSVSESGQDVVSTSQTTRSGWGVIVQEPTTSIYAGVNSYVQLAGAVGIIAAVFSTITALLFSSQLIRPIKRLSKGARRLGQGDFTQKIDVRSKDEFQELADVFNSMGANINSLVGDLKSNNLDLTLEQSKLKSIINSVNDGVIAINGSEQIISVNPPAAKLVNEIPYALRGKSMRDVFTWTHDGAPFKLELIKTGIHSYGDIMLAKGETISYLDLMVEVIDRKDSDIAAIITIHDQTASRELNFMKLDFVAIAAHELRTPLTVISGYLDMLNTEAQRELSIFNLESLQKAIVGANQLRELINKLLNIARIERGDMEIFIEKLNLTQLVNRNVEQHQAVALQKEQTLRFDVDTAGSMYVPADTASIVEVLNNLIGNALKYTPKGGKIHVTVTTVVNDVVVQVSDNGPGVPEELRTQLFTKFYRAERSLIAGTRGTGLGLFISKTIIELQNGTIGIRPDEGRGSVFYFTLPSYNPARDDALVAKNISGGIHGWFKKRTNN